MQERQSVASKSTVSSEDRLLLDIQRKRDEKARQKQKAQRYFEKLKAHSVYESKDTFLKKEISLKLQPAETEKTKLFGLTQAKAPLIHRLHKPKALTSEEIELLAIKSHGTFKARPFKKQLFQERNSVPPQPTPKKSELSFALQSERKSAAPVLKKL
jgi:hypothetical protein